MKLFLPMILMAASPTVFSQNVDFNKVILPEYVTNVSFEEKLIQLAWKNHPTNKVVTQNVETAKKEVKLARWRWLDDIYANGNLNEFTINPAPNTSSNVFFPRYNFGVRLSLGTIFTTPIQAKIASDKLSVAEIEVNERKLIVREQVLVGIEKLKQFYKFLKLREQIKEDYLSIYKDSEKKFSTGEIDIEKYRSAVQTYLGQAERVVEAESSFNGSRVALEALLGLGLTDIEGYAQFLQRLDLEIKID